MSIVLTSLPRTLPRENAVRLDLVDGIVVFKASTAVQDRVEELVEKEKTDKLSLSETAELDAYEEIDDYLSYVNRLVRNSAESGEMNLAA